jgi:hypothetical protein
VRLHDSDWETEGAVALNIDRSRPEQAKVRFSWPSTEPSGTISVVGSFNEWTPGLDELSDGPDGGRSVTVGLPYGVEIVFRYLGPDGQWFDDPDADEISQRGSSIRPIKAPSSAERRT